MSVERRIRRAGIIACGWCRKFARLASQALLDSVRILGAGGSIGRFGFMKTIIRRFFLLGLLVVTANALTHPASAAPINSWSSTADGKWEIGSNWSTGAPPKSAEALLITNTAPAHGRGEIGRNGPPGPRRTARKPS